MKRAALAAAAGLLLAGCLEVEQHPPWRHGYFNGKPDPLPAQAHFHGDRMAWIAAIIDRNWRQDEFARTLSRGAPYE